MRTLISFLWIRYHPVPIVAEMSQYEEKHYKNETLSHPITNMQCFWGTCITGPIYWDIRQNSLQKYVYNDNCSRSFSVFPYIRFRSCWLNLISIPLVNRKTKFHFCIYPRCETMNSEFGCNTHLWLIKFFLFEFWTGIFLYLEHPFKTFV